MEAVRTFLFIDVLLIILCTYIYVIVYAYNQQQRENAAEVKEVDL